ncbi:MAG: hypothetical protein VKN60_11440 [Cyanobacteriota bacterium]|nr:hypothetical protein [Cyanobacteriota bacterium]
MLTSWLDRLGNWNPQLLRELKGRLQPRAVAVVAFLSFCAQVQLVLFFRDLLPTQIDPRQTVYNRYCLGPEAETSSYKTGYECVVNFAGSLELNWRLWGLDLFVTLSIIGAIALLAVSFYLLCADMGKEESRGTFNFIRLSPRSAQSVMVGKLLGVPALLYLFLGLGLPLHLGAGFLARVPLSLILLFYGVVLAGAAFWGLVALLLGLSQKGKWSGVQSFGGAGLLAWFLGVNTIMVMSGVPYLLGAWAGLFNPLAGLTGLIHSARLAPEMIGYGLRDGQGGHQGLLWYGMPIFRQGWTALGFMIANFSVGVYWLSRGIQRRFRSPQRLLISKAQSYGLTASFALATAGFLFQNWDSFGAHGDLRLANLVNLQVYSFIFLALLAFALSPDRTQLEDWLQNRGQLPRGKRGLVDNLLWGENSPAPLALGVNAGLLFLFIAPSLLLLADSGADQVFGLLAWALGLVFVWVCGFWTQAALTVKGLQRGSAVAVVFVGLGIVLPLLTAYLTRTWSFGAFFWWSPLPLIALASPIHSLSSGAWLWGAAGNGLLLILGVLACWRQLDQLRRAQSLWLETAPSQRLMSPKF